MGPRRFIIFLTALLSVCGLIVGPASGASCAFSIEWNGVPYDAGYFDQTITLGPSLGKAIVPPCEDDGGPGCRREGGEEIAISRLPGVDPHIAVGGSTALGREVFLAKGFFPQLPDHPLHKLAYGSAGRPNERRGWRCGDAMPGLAGTAMQCSAPARASLPRPQRGHWEGGWRNFPSYTRLRSAGCYAYQVDGVGFTDIIAFEVAIWGS